VRDDAFHLVSYVINISIEMSEGSIEMYEDVAWI
jgi:hypothetical protein